MSNADDGVSSSSPIQGDRKRILLYPAALLDRQHEVSFSPLTQLWYVSIIGSDSTFTASAKTLKDAAKSAIEKSHR